MTRLRGMFAFALWDARDGTLFAARDHLGVKPFHYAWDGHTLVFGSELKAVLAHPAVAADIDSLALRLYLECQFIPAPHSVFRAVRKLPPGHTLKLAGHALALKPFWRLDYARQAGARPSAKPPTPSTASCARRSKACWSRTCRSARS